MKRVIAYGIISIPYIMGCAAGWALFLWLNPSIDDTAILLMALLAADLVATAVVWVFGLAFRNSSFYDPYWSLVPWLIILAVMLHFSLFHPASILFLTVLGIWSWRLTVNWAYTCRSLKSEDWRYTNYRAQNKFWIWHIINVFGIHYVPTLIVFFALVPGVLAVVAGGSIGLFHILGSLIIVLGTLIETAADISMHRFLKTTARENRMAVNQNGLWSYCRHPNYLGEILIWVGVYVFSLSVQNAVWWFGGSLAVILLFLFISIPLAEKRHLSRRPDYASYRSSTPKLLPFLNFKK